MKYKVEDHGNGFMVIRKKTNKLVWPKFCGVEPDEARKVLREYIGKKAAKAHRFACPTFYDGTSACWLSTTPGAVWDGATDPLGNALARS